MDIRPIAQPIRFAFEDFHACAHHRFQSELCRA